MPDGASASEILVSPAGNAALVLAASSSGATVAYLFNTSTNQVGAPFPVLDLWISSIAFTPDGASVWLIYPGQTSPPNTLVGGTFPGGSVIGQVVTDADSIAFQPSP